ncbi:MAG TPA: PhzF family phenazine biosynthesis protein [Blastocatellia bacterium]|nr:PhzF family phenazine biosynthesis protein [Blastocatellia bacterium]
MNGKKFVIADVFTDERFGGNQLAVYTDARGLDTATMQNIAREMNYSETTFLLPAEQGGDYRVRIFTPRSELPFAGHPLVGSGFVIVSEKMKEWSEPLTSLDLETGVGLIRVEVETRLGRAGHSTMTQPLPVSKGTFNDIATLARALSLEVSDIERTGLPVEPIHNGITTMIVPVATLAAVEQIKIDAGALERISIETGVDTVLAVTLETLIPSSTAHCRVFAPAQGILEDAATGSANGPLGFYLVSHKLVKPKRITKIVSEQGYEMKRPSLLHIEVETDETSGEVVGVRVGGGVVIAGRGEIFVS